MLDPIIRSIGVQLLFRGLVPGVFFVGSLIVATKGWGAIIGDTCEFSAAWLLGAAAFSGVVAYTLHRSLLYPIVEGVLDTWLEGCGPIRQRTIKRLEREWRFGAKVAKENAALSRHLTAWNDYVHLQYASALCIALGALGGVLVGADPGYEIACDPAMQLIFGALVAAALIGDFRRRAVVDLIVPKDEVDKLSDPS